MDSSKSRYQFKPLENVRSIRILVLHPAMNDDDELVAHIEHQERRTAEDTVELQHFEAISYTWGAPVMDKNLICEGACMPITENVDILLRRLRTNRERRLWIDAICLNQADDEEKRRQVPLMGEIYREASNVLVWLGDASPEDSRAVDTLRKLLIAGSTIELSRQEEMGTLCNLLLRPWFTRRWVLQEVTAHSNTTMMFGNQCFTWAELVKVIPIAFEKPRAENSFDFVVMNVGGRLNALRNLPQTLPDLIWAFHDTQCADKRDRINALLGLLRHPGWTPDYSAHWAAEYERLVRTILSRPSGFRVVQDHLQSFGSLREKVSTSPSWVPDWSQPIIPSPFTHWLYAISLYDACGYGAVQNLERLVERHLDVLWTLARSYSHKFNGPPNVHTGTDECFHQIVAYSVNDHPSTVLGKMFQSMRQIYKLEIVKVASVLSELANFILRLLSVHELWSAYFNVKGGLYEYWRKFLNEWLEYIYTNSGTETVKQPVLITGMTHAKLQLREAFFLNDVLIPSLSLLFRKHTLLWAVERASRDKPKPGESQRKGRMAVGVTHDNPGNADKLNLRPLVEYSPYHSDIRLGELRSSSSPDSVEVLYWYLL